MSTKMRVLHGMDHLRGVEERFAAGLAGVLAEVGPFLDERQRRLLLGSAARQIGHGGIAMIASATGAAASTVGRGSAELEAGAEPDGRVRVEGRGPQAGHRAGPWDRRGAGSASRSRVAGRSDAGAAVDDQVDRASGG